MAQPTAGVIGLGNMGRGIATNLQKAGYKLAVWDVNSDATAPFAKIKDVEVLAPSEMARKSSVIFFIVPGSDEIEEMLGGRGGMLSAARKNLVLYDFTTSDPNKTKTIARKAARKGVAYLDAGMSGGASGALAGTLTLMIGGDEAAYKRSRRHLKPFTDNLFYLGKSGAGHTLKLIHNMVCHTNFLAVCEGGRLAEQAGIDLSDMIDVFNVSNARSYISEARFPRHILSKKWDGGSRVYNLHKDLAMAVDMADNLGASTPLGRDTLAFLKKAIGQDMAEQDFTLLYPAFDKLQAKPKKKPRRKTS